MTPKRRNVRFFATSAAAQQHGFRACKRCRPDASPGSPEWQWRDDVVARAMRHIADGLVEREGVAGLARRLGYSERHLHRLLVETVGAGPLALARAQRGVTARTLIETTSMTFTDVAFAAGFGSIRQFNDTVRQVYGVAPSDLRRHADSRAAGRFESRIGGGRFSGPVTLSFSIRLPYRPPLCAATLFGFLARRCVTSVERCNGLEYARSLRLPNGPGVVSLTPDVDHIRCVLALDDLRDLGAAVARSRRLLDLDADPVAIDEFFADDELLGALVRRTPGVRSPGAVDGNELAIRAVLGQQVSVKAARTHASRLVDRCGEQLPKPLRRDGVTHLFPTAEAVAGLPDQAMSLPAGRRRALRRLCESLAGGEVDLDVGADRAVARTDLCRIPGIGPWTAEYIALRALSDPDAFMPSDLGVRAAMRALQLGSTSPVSTKQCSEIAEKWRPWRSYGIHHLWRTLDTTDSRLPSPIAPVTDHVGPHLRKRSSAASEATLNDTTSPQDPSRSDRHRRRT